MKVAIYSRKSLETDKGDSIKNQIEICKEYFLRREKNIAFEIFEDEGFSGGNTNRPGFKLMLSKANNKEFDIIACYKIDRIARNIVDFVNIYDSLDKLGIKLVSVTEGFDASTPLGKLIMMILASFAEMERENIRQRVKDNMKALAKLGKWSGGKEPFGYTITRVEKEGKKATYLKLLEDKIELIKDIFDTYLKTNSMHQVNKWLYNEKQIKWPLSTVKNVLTSPVYVRADNEVLKYLSNFGEIFGECNNTNGLLTYNRRPYTNGAHRWNDKSMFYAVSKHEGIIDSKAWLRVQMLQEKNKINPRPKNSQVSYLTGVLKCRKCGSPMTISYNHKNKDGSITYVYICTGRKTYGKDYCNCSQVKQSILDRCVEESFTAYTQLDMNDFKKIFDKDTDNSLPQKILLLEKKIETNNKKINNLIDKLMLLSNEAGIPLTRKIEELTKENEIAKKDLTFMHQENANKGVRNIEYKYEQLKFFTKVLDSADIDTKRDLIKGLVEEIQWDNDIKFVEIII